MLPRRRSAAATASPIALLLIVMAVTTTVQAFLLPSSLTVPSRWTQAASRQRALYGQGVVALSATSAEPAPARKYHTRFDPEKGARLASFSFAVYGNPSGSRFFRSKDGSDIGFHDDEVRTGFDLYDYRGSGSRAWIK